MENKSKYTFTRMDLDTSPNKHTPEVYFKGRNIRVVTTGEQTTGAITNEKGDVFYLRVPFITSISPEISYVFNTQTFSTPTITEPSVLANLAGNEIADNHVIVGFGTILDQIIFFTYNTVSQNNAIWKVDASTNTPTIELIYINNLGITPSNPVRRVIVNKENRDIVKIYWVTENTILRAIKLGSNSINTPLTNLDVAPSINYSTPEVISLLSGGTLQPGVYQYAYSLYTNLGTETKVSPLSDPYTISEPLRGTMPNIDTGVSAEVEITNLDNRFDFIKLYRIAYLEGTAEPEISFITESEIVNSSFFYVDGGGIPISLLGVEEFLSLGNDPFVVKDIAIKDSRMIAANIVYNKFDIDFEARAYRFDSNQNALLKDNNRPDITINGPNPNYDQVPENFDCINPSNFAETNRNVSLNQSNSNADYQKYIYTSDGTTLGAEGKHIIVKIKSESRAIDNSSAINPEYLQSTESHLNGLNYKFRSRKRDEIYRLGIRFINDKGQYSFPKWICDLRMPTANTHILVNKTPNPTFNILHYEVELKNNFTLPSNIVGYQIVEVPRKLGDRTIIAQGYVTSMIRTPFNENAAGNPQYRNVKMPSWNMRSWHTNDNNMRNSSLNRISHLFPLSSTNTLSGIPTILDLNQQFNEGALLNYPTRGAAQGTELGGNLGDNISNYHRQDSADVHFYSPEVNIFKSGINLSPENYLVVSYGSEVGASQSWQYNSTRLNLSETVQDFHAQTSNLWSGGLYRTVGTNEGRIIPNSSNIRNYKAIIRKGTFSNSVEGTPSRIPLSVTPTYVADSRTPSIIDLNAQTGARIISKPFAITDSQRVFEANHCESLILSFQDSFEGSFRGHLASGGPNGDDFSNSLFTAVGIPMFVSVDLKRTLPNQYGGNTFSARTLNDYLPVSKVYAFNERVNNIYNGDTFVTYYNFLRLEAVNTDDFIDGASFSEVVMVPIETTINLDLRNDTDNYKFAKLPQVEKTLESFHIYNNAFGRVPDAVKSFSKPFNFNEIEEFKNRVIASDNKINGELIDSWLKFRPLNFLDIDNIYGDINGIMTHNNEVYAFQDNAVSMLRINPRVIIQDIDGVGLEQGTGQVLQDVMYLSTSSGTKNQFSIVNTPYGIYYYDTLAKEFKIISKNQDTPEGLVKGLFSYINNVSNEVNLDNPYLLKGISGNYFNQFKEQYHIVLDPNGQVPIESVANNFLAQGYTSFYNYNKPFLIPSQSNLFGIASDFKRVFKMKEGDYGKFTGINYDSSVTLIVNHNADFTKTLDNALFNSVVTISGIEVPLSTLTSILVTNDYQTTGEVPLVVNQNVRRKFREWRIAVPREKDSRNRIRSQYFYVTLNFKNEDNKKLVLYDVIFTHTLAPASFI